MSSGQFVIAGFPSTDFVPGGYGQVKYGAGATSAASIPLKLLVVGMKAANATGTATADVSVDQIFDVASADALYGAGGQITRAVQAALQIQGVQVWGAPVAVPSGPTAATVQFAITASQTKAGTLTVRLGGLTAQCGVGAADAATAIGDNLVTAIQQIPRMPFTAANASGVVTATAITAGADGNQYVAAVDTSQCPGVTVSMTGNVWAAATPFALNSYAHPTTAHANGFFFKATAIAGTGTTGGAEPTWPTTIGSTVVDNTGGNQITWTCWGQILTGGLTTAAGGAGAENVTNILAVINNQQFDRIAVCQNDATNLGRWKTQIDAQAGPLTLLLQHVVAGTNGTLSAANTLAQGTLNDQRFQLLWMLNGETHPSEMAAIFAALRTQAEQSDPDAAYDNTILPGVYGQSQRQDWPQHSTLVSALNNGVTPVSTNPDGSAYIVRSITTRSQNGSVPDYTTLDTSEAVVPDFCLRSLLLYWKSSFLVANPRVAPDPLPNQKPYLPGIGYPILWSALATAQLLNFQDGKVGGTQIPPILYLVDSNPVVSTWDPIAERIMSAVTVHPMPNQHQIGVSVSQAP